jgi:hypothetical protein
LVFELALESTQTRQVVDVAISNAHAEQIELDDSVVLRIHPMIMSMAPQWAPDVGV